MGLGASGQAAEVSWTQGWQSARAASPRMSYAMKYISFKASSVLAMMALIFACTSADKGSEMWLSRIAWVSSTRVWPKGLSGILRGTPYM